MLMVAVFAIYVFMYGLGLAFSRGYHRGKREFVDNLLKDNRMYEVDYKEGVK